MRNNVHIPSRDAAILEALVIDRATIMFQTIWHTGASVLFEEIERFNNRLQNAGGAAASRESVAPRSDETSPTTQTGGVAWGTH
ncbi:MAG: hypothetical protein JWN13_2424 [Betaproteobacteria bacterium]|jgi:hypothetical protein|nr:hypothetical protein [Betaproteobacteria bacterium]MEA3156679.1 hypothetical protein [Betaproteobacteria bacterium]